MVGASGVGENNMSNGQEQPLTPAQIAALLHPQMIQWELQAREKIHALREIAALLRNHPAVAKPEAFFREILMRERVSNTGLGNGLAMPHVRTDLCDDIVMAVGRSVPGIDYGAPDGQPVQLLFLIGTPLGQLTRYHRVIVGLARLLASPTNRLHLLAAHDAASFISAIATLRA